MGVMALFIACFLIVAVSGVAANRGKRVEESHQSQLSRNIFKAQKSNSELQDQVQVVTSTGCFFWESDCVTAKVLCGDDAIVFGKLTDNKCKKFVYFWNHADMECSGPKYTVDQFQECFWQTIHQFVPRRDKCDDICAESHGSMAQKVQGCELQCDHIYDCKDKCQGNEYKFKDSISMCLSDCMESSPMNPAGTCKGSCGTHSPNMKCRCDPTCVFMNDCCQDYENFCQVTNLRPGEELKPPETPSFNVSNKEIKSFKAKYAVTFKPAPPLPKPGKGKGKGKTRYGLGFLQLQTTPDAEKISEVLKPKVAEMVKRLTQRVTDDPRRAMLLQSLQAFLEDKLLKGHSTPEAKARIDALVKNLMVFRGEEKVVQGQRKESLPAPNLPSLPLFVAAPAAVMGAPALNIVEDQSTAAEIAEESDKLGHAVEDINEDVNDIFHLLEQQEYWHQRTPVLKSIVADFTSRYEASLYNLWASVNGIAAPAGAPGGPGGAPSAAPSAAPVGSSPAAAR